MRNYRCYYWSNTVFADKVRKAFGIDPQPKAASFDGWEDYKTKARQTSSFGYKVVESLDTIQSAVCWVPDKFKSISYYLSNAKNLTHVLKTNTKLGQWGDLTSKIPDALMLSIIEFIEQECFWMNIAFFDKQQENMSAAVWKYKTQSYIRRKLFSVKVTDSERAVHGIEYLNFQIESSGITNDTEHPYNKLIQAYWFAKTRYGCDLYEESGYTAASAGDSITDNIFGSSPEKTKAYNRLDRLEKVYNKRVVIHCTNIVKYHDYLWT